MKQDDMRFEDWKKETVKYELERKHQYAGNLISNAFRTQILNDVMFAFEAVHDYLVTIPLEESDNEGKSRIDEFLKRMDDINDVIWGVSSDERVKSLRGRFNIIESDVKISSIRVTKQLSNFQYLLRELRDIHLNAGYFATSSGLRITIHKKRKTGMSAELYEEGFLEEE